MNQVLKDIVYGKGNTRQVEFIAEIGGMNKEEREVFIGMHEGKSDAVIQDLMAIDTKTFKKIESSMRSKLSIAVFECINSHMDKLNN